MPEHTHAFSVWPFDDAINTVTYCTVHVAEQRLPVLQVAHDTDGDWQFFDASEDDPGKAVLLCLGCVLEHDPTLAQISDLPRGWGAFREHVGASWERWEEEAEPSAPPDCEHDPHAGEQKALADIDRFGLHVIGVREEGDLPPFSYSIGIERSLGLPELIVIGLKNDVAHSVINACYVQMKAGQAVTPGTRVDGLLGGDFSCVIGAVDPEYFTEYMGWALWLYAGPHFRALQIVFPSTAGVFPWEPAATDWFRMRQPLLTASAGGDVLP